MEETGTVVLCVIWWIFIGDTLLGWKGGDAYSRWKVRTAISRTFVVVLLWPLFIWG